MKARYNILLSVLITLSIFSCKRNDIAEIGDMQPKFSTDTLSFDTVFQTVGSATRYFMVYNPYSVPLKIDEVCLARGADSPFRINFNGRSATRFQDVSIPGNDSVYVFTEVTVDPAENDLLEKDSLMFTVKGNYSDVKLIAYGRDVHLINDSVVGTQTWTADKPFLITNSMAVDENAVLTIEEGCELHFSRNSRLLVLGTLIANGRADNPIVFQGDRLEEMYSDVSGQWQGIWMTKLSKDNYFNHTVIKNAHIGIQVDSVQNSNPMLTILNSKVQHHSLIGIYAQMSSIFAANLLVADCGRHALALTRGGSYRFYHSTIANYWRSTVRTSPSVILNNYYVHNDAAYIYDLTEAYFGNCIISGNVKDEIGGDFYTDGVELNYTFENTLFNISEESGLNPDDTQHFINIMTNTDPKFVDIYEYDFRLDTLSPAKDKGSMNIVNQFPELLNFDILNQSRISDAAPDLGAFERIEE
jgi:hypothetical protein